MAYDNVLDDWNKRNGKPAIDLPDGLYVVRNGVAVAVTVERLAEAIVNQFTSRPMTRAADVDLARQVIAALTRPADGADA